MRALSVSIAIGLVVGGCHKEGQQAPGGPPSTADADALWKLAPDDAIIAVVVSPRALALVEHGAQDIHAFMAAIPAFAKALETPDRELKDRTGSTAFSLAAFGLSTQKGGAVFVNKSGTPIVVVPLGDRDKFLAVAHGKKADAGDTFDRATCKTTHGVYACSTDAAYLDKLGSGGALAEKLAPAHARGDIEVVVAEIPVAKLAKLRVAGVVQLERGAMTIRAAVTGAPSEITSQLGDATRPVDTEHATGFGLIHLQMLLGAAVGAMGRDVEILPGLDARTLFGALGDPVTMVSYPGGADVRVPLKDEAPFRKLLEQCGTPQMAALGATKVDGGCRIAQPQLPALAMDIWIEDKVLHYGIKGSKPDTSLTPTPLGKELADASWQMVFWGHGSALASTVALLDQLPFPAEMKPYVGPVTTSVAMLNEAAMGFRIDGDTVHVLLAARTAWSNPDDVVKQLVAIDGEDILRGKGPESAKPILAAAPNSPFAKDFHAGATGMLMPMSLVGVLAAVAIPAFMDYMKKSKKSEASLQLNRIGKSLKRYYAENSAFPTGDAGPKDAVGCCGGKTADGIVNNKCPPDPKAWQSDKIWSALDFSIDEPTLYQYRYHSDGQSAVVEAIGDVDCDTNAATWRLDVKLNGGVPVMDIHAPAAGVY